LYHLYQLTLTVNLLACKIKWHTTLYPFDAAIGNQSGKEDTLCTAVVGLTWFSELFRCFTR